MLPRADPQRFVGRHRQLVALTEALEARSRLVTLHGPSGVGKSRLAAEHLRGVAEERRTAAVDLEDVTALGDALALIASALEAPAAAADPVHVLAERLRELGPLTLVFDHVDGVSGELAGPLSRWLATCPETHFVITATRPLALPDEHPCAVEPLSLPVSKGDRVPSDALRLWHLLRGSEVRRDKPVDAELVELLRALGGLPLLIELMAALAERLTPFALLERLSPRLRALGPSPAPDVVLGPVLDAVWNAMSDPERQAFAGCAVFGASFDREAYAAVHASGNGHQPAISADEALARLEKRRLLSPLHTTDHSERFGLHHALRRAARERLSALDPRGEAVRRHARYFVEKGGALAEALEGKDGPSATRALVREQSNLLAIVARAPLLGDVSDVSVLLRALCVHDHVLSSFGPVDADVARLDRALEAADGLAIAPDLLTEALCVRAFVRGRTGAFEQSFADLARAQALAGEAPLADTYPAGRVAVTVAFVCLSAGRLDEAEAEAGRALAIAERVGHLRLRGIALGVYALIRRVRGHEGEARSLYEQALEHHRTVENRRFEGIVMTRLAQLLADAGETERALSLADDALVVHRTFGDRLMEGMCLEVRGIVTQARGELEEARRALEAARPLLAAAGGAGATNTHALLARVRTELGDFDLARQLLALSRRDYLARGAQAEALLSLARAAGLEALYGEAEAAESSFAEIERYEVEGLSLALVNIERAQLDLYALRRALARGASEQAAAARLRALEKREQLASALDHSPAARFRELADARASLRVFDMLLAGHGTVSPGAATVMTTAGPSVSVAQGSRALALSLSTRSFVAPSGERVDVGERPALRRILTRLGVHALRAPGRPHRALELFAAGWPGENPGEENARLQVYAVLAMLRKLGLGEALISNDQGHLLSPSVAVRFTA